MMSRTARLARVERTLTGPATAAALEEVAEELRGLVEGLGGGLEAGELEPVARRLKSIGILLDGQAAWVEGWQAELRGLGPEPEPSAVVCHG